MSVFVLPSEKTTMQVQGVIMAKKPTYEALEQRIRELEESESERKLAEKALRSKETYLSTILQTTAEGFWVVDTRGYITDVNEAYCALSGYDREEILGLHIGDIDADESSAQTEERIQRIIDNGSELFEARHRRKDGKVFPVEISITYLNEGGGKFICFSRDLEKRKHAEMESAHSRDLLRYIVEHANSAVAVHDRDLHYIYVSQKYLDQYKVNEKEIIGKHHYDVFPDLPQKWRDMHQKALKGEISKADRDPYYRDDGTVEWTRWECRPWYEADGTIGGFIIYTEMITDRVQAEEALKESEALLAQSQSIAHVGSWKLDVAENRLIWSDETYRIFGVEPQAFPATYEAFLDSVHPDDREAVDTAYKNSIQGRKTSYEIEHRIIQKSTNQVRYAFEKCFHRKDEKGNIIESIGIIQDITDRKRAEINLKKSMEFQRTMIATSPVALYSIDRQGIVMTWNESAEKIFGWKEDEVIGKTLPFVPDEKQHKFYELELRKQVLAGKTFSKLEIMRQRKNSELFHCSLSTAAIRDENDIIIGIMGALEDVTDRKKAENELQKNQNRTHSILNGIADTFYSLDKNWRFTIVNPAAEKAPFGLSAEELIGKVIWDLYPGLKGTNIHQHYLNAAKNYSLEHYEAQSPLDSRWYEVFMQGWQKGVDVYMRDITKRKQAEEALRNSEERFRNLIETMNDVIFEVDGQGIITYVSPSGYKFWEGRMCDVLGRHFMELVHFEDRELLEKRFNDLQQGIEKPISYRLMTEHEDECWVRSHSTAIWKNGQFAGARGILMDITAQKKAKEAHLKAEQKLLDRNRFIEAILDHLPIGLAVNYIEEGTATYMNKQFEDIYGWPKEDLIDIEQFFKNVYPEVHYREELKKRIFDDIQSGDSKRMFWEGIEATRKDGRKRIVSAKNIPLFDQNIMISTVQDVTESKQLQEQLAQVQKMEAVGRLAGGVAHDLNNLLSPILGYGEMLVEDISREDSRRELVEEIVLAGYRARDLVRQLLAFSRKQALEFRMVDANKVIQDFEKLLRRTVREDIQIGMNFASDLPPIQADVGQIEQVIMNLAVNAQDAMPYGGNLTIESGIVDLDETYATKHEGAKPGRYVMLAVSDTGHGMDSETLERVFEPFYTTKGKGKGTGLGLSTVYGIVKQHGGNVWVYSEPGEGTTFTCYFPAVEDSNARVEEPLVRSTKEPRGNETVVVVEDSESVRRLAVSILRRQGYNVYGASSCEECLRLFQEQSDSIGLLITDVVMPDMNGKELYQHVAGLKPDIKVLYASGYTDNVIAHHGVLDEGIHFIQKPFSVHGLTTKVREVLNEDKAR